MGNNDTGNDKAIEAMTSDELVSLLGKIDWATLSTAISKKYNCLLISEEKWSAVTQALLDEVGCEGWNSDWDY